MQPADCYSFRERVCCVSIGCNVAQERILLIENPADLSIDIGRLRIRRGGMPEAFVAPHDVAVLVLHHHTIALTVHTLRVLTQAGAAVMVTDETHMPCGLLLPAQANRKSPSRLRQQIALLDAPLSAVLWQALVQARIRTEAATLRALGLKGALRLERMIEEVEPGDVTHREGQAARHYWQHLFDDFKREKQGAKDAVNARLNYGYAVLRSLIARELAAAGLSPELGLGHKSLENPFNLADDFMEPYRFAVEVCVKRADLDAAFDGAARVAVVGFVETEIALGDESFRLTSAIRETIASYARILETGKGQLALPTG